MLRITEVKNFQSVTLYVSGEIDGVASPQLQSEIFRAARIKKDVTLEFGEVNLISDAGILVLRSGLRACAAKRGTLAIANASVKIKEAIRKEGLGRLLAT